MSFCAGGFLKLTRLFLRICKWVLFKMSVNFKLFGCVKRPSKGLDEKGAILSSWILGVLVGFFIFSVSFRDGIWKRKGTQIGNDVVLMEQFNVSMDKLLAVASMFSWSDQTGSSEYMKKMFEMAPCNGFGGAIKMYCVQENAPQKLSLSLLHGKITEQNNIDEKLQERAWKDQGRINCGMFSFYSVNLCCWIFLGAITSYYKFGSFHANLFKSRKRTSIQEQQFLSIPQKQEDRAKVPRSAGNWMTKLLLPFVYLLMLGSVWLFFFLNAGIVMRRKETLVNMCEQRAQVLQDQFNVSMNHVHSLALLVSTFHHGKRPSAIDQKTFSEYTERTAFERPLTSGVAYALKVTHSEREQFETKHGWTIKKMEEEDQMLVQNCTVENLDPSPVQDEYAPVIFTQETVSHIVSIDMMSGKEDRENILRARASGKGVLTSPFKLLKSNHLGVVLTFAVYRPGFSSDSTRDQRVEATVGYIGASYDIPSLVDKLLHQLATNASTPIVVNVYDTTNSSAHINMYGTEVIDTGLSHVSYIDFGDPSRKHEMHCRFKEKRPPPWIAIIAFLGVLIITILLRHIACATINEIAKVEHDFHQMMELKVRAEAADVAKTQFLATVSHEIRTPMNGVLGMLQLLMDTDLDAKQLDFAQIAHDSGNDLISLINELLDQAKIESGRLEIEDVPFDLRSILDHIMSLFYARYHEKGIELAVYVSEQVPEIVIGDPGRFQQIIANLVGNSIKFTRNKGHIFVSVHFVDEVVDRHRDTDEILRYGQDSVVDRLNNTNTLSGLPVVDRWKSWENFKNLTEPNFTNEPETVKLLITVEDTGIGICNDAQSRIFTPFMQADSSTSRKYGGTGIGLSISKCLVNLMSGEIGFESEPGVGSTFSFTVAFRKGDKTCTDTKYLHDFDIDILGCRGMRALVVDDRKIRAEVTKYHLRRLGIFSHTVSSLTCACSYLSSIRNTSTTQLAMIVVDEDIWDRDIDGGFRHIIREIRLDDAGPKILLLSNTASSSKHPDIKSNHLVDDVLLKPLRLSILISCFQGALGICKRRQLSKPKPGLGNLLQGKRILVVDDNVVNQRVAEGALKKYGAIVTCVGSGKDALEKLKPPHNFDACFMDLQMPEMDGFEATERVRRTESEINEKIELEPSNKAQWHTPILAMTADVIQAANECMKHGMDGYVSKPFKEGQLYSALANFFELES